MAIDRDSNAEKYAAALSMRPLGIGELLDRAFSLFFRNIIPLISLLAVVIIPLAIVQYLMVKDVLGVELGLIQGVFSHPSKPPDPSEINAMNAAALSSGYYVPIYYLLFFIALPIANAAVVVGISHAYLGQPVRFVECYRVALRRWLYTLFLVVLWFLSIAGLFFVLVFGMIFISVALGAIASLLKVVGVVLAAIIGIALALAVFALSIMAYMAFASSFVALVIEGVDPIRAFVLGFNRVFGGGLFWRSVVMSLAMLALFLGFGLVAGGLGALLFWFTKSSLVYVATGQLANLFFVAFAFVVVALYYYDVRIRREGFDLKVLADQVSGRASALTKPTA